MKTQIEKIHYRKTNRLRYYNYDQVGCYFVTICAKNRFGQWFGEINKGEMNLNKLGRLIDRTWKDASFYYKNIEIDQFIVMPNHIHGIIVITGDSNDVVTGQCPVTTNKIKNKINYGLLSKIVNSFKNITTKEASKLLRKNNFEWQRSFYDRIIRNEKELIDIREYIINNPLKWDLDRNNPQNIK